MTKQLAIITLIFILSSSAKAQNPSEFLPDKPGKMELLQQYKNDRNRLCCI
jgi:hypothetical protein